MSAIVQILIGVVIAAVSSLITVRLSRHQFRSERWWEKKVAAYERVIDAFHDFKKFSAEHMDAEVKDNSISKEREADLRARSTKATDEIKRASDIGSFLLSENALKILARYEAASEAAGHQPSWWEYLDNEWSTANEYMKEFIAEAQRDLKQ